MSIPAVLDSYSTDRDFSLILYEDASGLMQKSIGIGEELDDRLARKLSMYPDR